MALISLVLLLLLTLNKLLIITIILYLKILYGREHIAGGSPVSEEYMETCFSSNVAGGSPALESYMETIL